MQLKHENSKFSKRKFPIVIFCDRITKSSNVGSILRLADAFGIDKVFFLGHTTPLSHKTKKVSRAAEKYVDYEILEYTDSKLMTYISLGYKIVSLEISTHSIPVQSFNVNPVDKIALIIGNENEGVSSSLLKLSDQIIHVDMYGNNSSMNVSSAAAIALYHITNQLEASL